MHLSNRQCSAVASASENHLVNELWMSGTISPTLITDQPTYRMEICGQFKVGKAHLFRSVYKNTASTGVPGSDL